MLDSYVMDPITIGVVLTGIFGIRRALFWQDSKARAKKDPLGFWVGLVGHVSLLLAPVHTFFALYGTGCFIWAAIRAAWVKRYPSLAYKHQYLLPGNSLDIDDFVAEELLDPDLH